MKKLAELLSTFDAGEILEHIHAMVALVERDGTLVSWNRAFGDCKAKWPSHSDNLLECLPEKEKNKLRELLITDQNDSFMIEFDPDPEGKVLSLECTLVPAADGRAIIIAEQLNADSALAESIEHLNRRVKMFKMESEAAKKIAVKKQTEVDGVVAQANEVSHVDSLTFLPNRRRIVRELQDEVLRAERYGTILSISVADVDFFKRVNDTYGHLAGDEVLRHVGYALRDHIRHPDIAGRYGGEEFLILLPNTTAVEGGEQAERLCRHIRETKVQVNNHVISVTISIGVAQFQRGVDTWDTLLNRADTAMYEAKRKGRDRWTIAEENVNPT